MRKRTNILLSSALVAVLLVIALFGQASPRYGPTAPPASDTAAIKGRLLANLNSMPIRFERNRGQTDAEVLYLARTSGLTLYLTGNEAVFSLHPAAASGDLALRSRTGTGNEGAMLAKVSAAAPSAAVRYSLRGASPNPALRAGTQLPGKSNYFIGSDPAAWRTDIPNYADVRYENVYPGIDLAWHGTNSQLEYDFIVAPGADPAQIRLSITGADRIEMQDGQISLHTVAGTVRQPAPRIYQDGPDGRREIDGGYVLAGNEFGFKVGAYDPARALVIDPVVSYATYLGGNAYEDARGIAVDAQGNAYVAGLTTSTNFPTQNAFQPQNGGTYDAFVAKFSPDGSTLIYSTYLGGNGDEGENLLDGDNALAIDGQGNAYVAGRTHSTNFPTQNAFQPQYVGGAYDAFLTKLNAAGNGLVYSTYLGGTYSDYGTGVAVDSAGSAYVGGVTFSLDFPVLNPFQPTKTGFEDAFLTKFTPAGNALVYSTYLGGGTDVVANEVAVDSAGSAYLTGYTGSSDFHLRNAFQTTYNGNNDAFLTKFTPAGNDLVYSTYLGGAQTDFAYGLVVDAQNSAYVMGYTMSSDFPTQSPFQPNNAGGFDFFITRFSPTGTTLEYSTYLGGRYWDFGYGITVDSSRQAYVTGYSESDNFPMRNPLQPTRSGAADAVIAKLNAIGSDLVYSTYLGGTGVEFGLSVATDAQGSTYVAGSTTSTNFPTHNPYQPNYGGGDLDSYVMKILDQPLSTSTPGTPTTPTAQPTNTTAPTSTITATATAAQSSPTTPPATSTASASTPTTGATSTAQATATVCTITFSDVPPDNTFYPFVRCLACRGIVNGYPDGTFLPNNPVTRGQLAKIVSQSAGFMEPVSGQTFEDVVPGSTFYDYIERLASRSVMGGYQCGIDPGEPCGPGNRPYFRPNAGATRGQLTKIVSNAAGFNDTIPDTQYQFTDVEPGSTFWLYVERLLLNRPGVMSGYPCGSPSEPCDSENRPYFRPNNPLTRGQTSKIVANTFFPDCQTPRK
jgi:hypothetical protein